MRHPLDPTEPLNADFLSAVGETLTAFLARQQPLIDEVGVPELMNVARSATAGGKRLRPAFCYWSHVAATGLPEDDASLLAVAASLDLLHVSALVHDDLIDDADLRRGLPAAHKRFERYHADLGGRGEAARFGTSTAILLGDLLLIWSIELADTSGSPGLERTRPLLNAMRSEVTAGQFLDVSAQYGVTGSSSWEEQLAVARRVLEFKSARYSVRRPAQIGASLGGADETLLATLGEFGSVIGRAFQLRDDVLGVYGDPAVTGKPYGGDIHEGKATVLVLTALSEGDPADAAELSSLLGTAGLSDHDVARAARIIEESGALAQVEQRIDANLRHAQQLLSDTPMAEEGRTALAALADLSVNRAR